MSGAPRGRARIAVGRWRLRARFPSTPEGVRGARRPVHRASTAPPSRRRTTPAAIVVTLVAVLAAARASAESPPEIGYVFPAGGRAGETRDVVLGGYDWTPDVELLPHATGVSIALSGPSSRVLIPEPPHLFGYKARANDRPCPREFPARLSLPADLPPGLHRWQVASAGGVSPPGIFHVSRHGSVVEDRDRDGPQILPDLPLVIDGQIRRTEEIDRYRFTLRESGPVWIDVVARRILSPLHATLRVSDSTGQVLVDVADTAGRDVAATFAGKGGETYDLVIHDIDYAGDRSSVYRIELDVGPRVLATIPAHRQRGTNESTLLVGGGLSSSAPGEQSLARPLAVAGGDRHDESIDLPAGRVAVSIPLSVIPELVAPESTDAVPLQPPLALTGRFGGSSGSRAIVVDLPVGTWRVSARGACPTHPLDLDLSVVAPDGRELAAVDDVGGSTDPVASLAVAAAGPHRIVVGGRGLASAPLGPALWRLAIEPEAESFDAGSALATQVAVPIGGAAKVAVPIARAGGFAGPVTVAFRGLPDGVTAAEGIAVAAGAAEAAVELACAADAGSAATLATIVLSATTTDGRSIERVAPLAVATTMKPRVRIVPDGLDDVRKVHRGTTFRGPLTIHRLEGFDGPVTLEPTAKQQRHRQGMDGDEVVVPAGVTRCEYPVFVPEWMETTRTSRFIVNGAVEVTDPRGRRRTLLERQEMRLGMLPEGAIMTLSGPAEVRLRRGSTTVVDLDLALAAEFRTPPFSGPVRVELVAGPIGSPAGGKIAEGVAGETVLVADHDGDHVRCGLAIRVADEPRLVGETTLTIRATALEEGRWPVVSETVVRGIVE